MNKRFFNYFHFESLQTLCNGVNISVGFFNAPGLRGATLNAPLCVALIYYLYIVFIINLFEFY
jgi:hypothetical protein